MSLNGVSSTVFPNTLNGLDSLDLTSITINGQTLASLFVPYTGALSNVDLNNKSLVGVNGLTTGSVTSSGLVQSLNVTATALTTTNTLKVNSVPAGTTAKYLATNATGEVIEADITTKYVPYTGATAHVNLNAKNLSNVLTYSGTNVQVTSTETTSLLATGTTQLNTLRITNVQSGTQLTLLAVDSIGNVINGTAPLPTAINVTATTGATTYYPSFIANTSGGSQTIYSDNTFQTISYETGTKTLTSYQLKLLNVPAGTQTSILAIDSAGNVIQGTTPSPTQLLTTAIPAGSISYYPTLISDRTTGNKSYFNQNSVNTDNMYFQAPVLTTGLGTWYIPQLVINTAITLINARFATTPTVVLIGGVSYALGLNATNDVVAYVPSNQTAVTATTVNADFNLLFTATGISDPNITVNIDSGTNLKYNPATDRLTVPNLTVGTAATINDANLTGVPVAPTAAPGTNTTQIASCAFVIANSGSGYLPLIGGTMTGSITYANTALTPITLSSANLTAYTYSIRDSFWTLPMLEFTTKTLSTFGSVSIGVPIVITNTSTTNLMSLPFNASTSYSKSISNTGGDLFITFAGRTTSPVANGSVVFGNSIPVAINDTLSMNPAAAGILCNTYQNVSNATLQIQGFWSGANSGIRFDANASNSTTLSALWGTVNNSGWTFYNGNTTPVVMAGVNTVGLYANNAGYFTNYTGAITAGLGGVGSGDLVYYANSSGVHRFFSGATQALAITSSLLTSYAQSLYFDATVANPYTQYGTGNYVAKATSAGAFVNDAVTGDLVINSRTGNVRIAGGSQFARTTCTINATGIMFGDTGYGVRTVSGATYGCVSAYGLGLNGWNGYDLNNRYTFMSDTHNGGGSVGIHDNQYSWLWRSVAGTIYYDRPTQVYTNVPQQSYQPYQVLIGSNNNALQWGVIYSSFYKNNNVSWNAGVAVSSFYKASATAVLRCSGAVSYYVTGAGGYTTGVNFYNTDTATAYILYFTQFTNNAYNHVSFPIMAQYNGLPAGNYAIIVSCNGTTDGNDHLYLLSEICFG